MTYKKIISSIKRKFGKMKFCGDMNIDCVNCRVWLALSILDDLEMSERWSKQKKKKT